MTKSNELFQRAQKCIPGGVNSPVRAFKGVGGDPLFIHSAKGAYLFDEDGKEYVDYVGSWGPMIVGHTHPEVIDAVIKAVKNGLSFGAPTEQEILLAEKICALIPAIELIRFVNSGTEATMSAIRLARGFTRRNKIIKFAGCYHGHADSLLVSAGSGALTFGSPSSAGVPATFAAETIVCEFNEIETVRNAFEKWGEEIACVIVEPVAGNMNCILPRRDFLQGLREYCDKYQSVLIFDEVMTGFRVALGGASAHYNIKPDLITLGKIIGGGMPVGAFGGRQEIMSMLAPLGPVYQAGTLSGNPIAMAAGLATLELVSAPYFYENLKIKTEKLMQGLNACAKKFAIPFLTQSIGGMFGLFFTDQNKIEFFSEVKKCDVERFKKFFHAMLAQGIYLAPSAYEAGFVSSAHDEETLEKTLLAAEKSFLIMS